MHGESFHVTELIINVGLVTYENHSVDQVDSDANSYLHREMGAVLSSKYSRVKVYTYYKL